MKKVKFWTIDMIMLFAVVIIFLSFKIAKAEQLKIDFYDSFNHELQLTSGQVISLNGKDNNELNEQYVIVFYYNEVKHVHYTEELLNMLRFSEDVYIRDIYYNYYSNVIYTGFIYGLPVEDDLAK